MASDQAPKHVQIRHPVILLNIARTFREDFSAQGLYDATRSAWPVSVKMLNRPHYALAVFRGVVQEVYEIAGWHPGGSTMRSTDPDGKHPSDPDRWEFVGKVAEESIRQEYRDKRVDQYFPQGAQNPVRYVNCGDQ